MGYWGATLAQLFTHAGAADVWLRDVTRALKENGATECGWRYALEARRGFGGFWKSQLVEFCLGRRQLAFACSPKPGQWPCGGCHHKKRPCATLARWVGRSTNTATRVGGWGDEKFIKERLCISLPYVETFNSKVIKGFVPELRSRYVFFVFRDSYVLCIYIYEHSMYISHSHIMAM